MSTPETPTPNKVLEAIEHTLTQIREREYVAYYLGIGTQTFGVLTEAYAELTGKPIDKVKEDWTPLQATNPFEAGRESGIVDEDPKVPEDIARESLEAERRAMRKPILDMLDLFPCLTGINWATTDTEQLIEIVHQHILRDRKDLETLQHPAFIIEADQTGVQ